uniref:Interferon-induced GTP-binding protein Mx n=1 Tax=Esox lucius TaxID=8010 RepID=A0A6Q2X3S6_ESOLU
MSCHSSTTRMFQDQLKEKVRPLIDLIDEMRYLGIEKQLNLPAIVVVGDQSSGKSSVLEALSGVALPRGTGIVTRCPLLLQLCYEKHNVWKAEISYCEQMHEFTEPSKVVNYVEEAQNDLAGEGDGICEELITLKIKSNTVCDLTLIDLPGIARVAVKGQPEDIGEKIKGLILNYIKRKETIILVVVPCNVDIATTEALQMAQQVDVEGTRTLAILTKPDLIDPGAENTILDIVHNRTIPLNLGYVIVKCRGQKQIDENMSIIDAIEDEKEFFKRHLHFSSLEEKTTIINLSRKLTVTLVEHIKISLPEMSEKIKKLLGDVRDKLNKLKHEPPQDLSEKRKHLIKVMTVFIEKITQLSKGDIITEGNLFVLMRKDYKQWMGILTNSIENYQKHVQEVAAEYDKTHRGSELPGFSNYNVFRQVAQTLLGELVNPAMMTVHSVREMVQKQFDILSKDCFEGYSFLQEFSKRNIESIQDQQSQMAMGRIKEQFEMEMLVYTQDEIFNIQNKLDSETTDYTEQDKRTNYPELLKAYYEIVVQRMGDQVPMLIYYFILKEGAKNVCSEMLSLLYEDDIDKILQEDSCIEMNRAKLKAQLKCLLHANEKLNNL